MKINKFFKLSVASCLSLACNFPFASCDTSEWNTSTPDYPCKKIADNLLTTEVSQAITSTNAKRRLLNSFFANSHSETFSLAVYKMIEQEIFNKEELSRILSFFSSDVQHLIDNKVFSSKLPEFIEKCRSLDAKTLDIINAIKEKANSGNFEAKNMCVSLKINPVMIFAEDTYVADENEIMKEIKQIRLNILRGKKLNSDLVKSLAKLYDYEYIRKTHSIGTSNEQDESWKETPWLKAIEQLFLDFTDSNAVITSANKYKQDLLAELDTIAYYKYIPQY